MAANNNEKRRGLFGQRHRTAREAVFESQRGRLLDAMVHAVAQKGYADVTIADVVAGASVSRRTFYEQFGDKEECFLAALDTGFEFVFDRIATEFAAIEDHDWRTQVKVAVETYLETIAAEPEFARVVHIDALAASDKARQRWSGVLQRFVDFYYEQNTQARAEDPSVPEIDESVMLAMVGGIADVAREHISRGELEHLPDHRDSLVAFAQGVIAGEWRAAAPKGRRTRRAA